MDQAAWISMYNESKTMYIRGMCPTPKLMSNGGQLSIPVSRTARKETLQEKKKHFFTCGFRYSLSATHTNLVSFF